MHDPSWYGEYDENGVNLSIIRANLKRTPVERLRRGDRTARCMLELIAYVKREVARRASEGTSHSGMIDLSA
jgi:hypothetical protein